MAFLALLRSTTGSASAVVVDAVNGATVISDKFSVVKAVSPKTLPTAAETEISNASFMTEAVGRGWRMISRFCFGWGARFFILFFFFPHFLHHPKADRTGMDRKSASRALKLFLRFSDEASTLGD